MVCLGWLLCGRDILLVWSLAFSSKDFACHKGLVIAFRWAGALALGPFVSILLLSSACIFS